MGYSLTQIFLLAFMGFTLAAPFGPVNMTMLKKSLAHTKGWMIGLIVGIGAMTADFTVSMLILFIGAEFLSNLLEVRIFKVVLFSLNFIILLFIAISAFRMDESNFITEGKSDDQLKNQFSFLNVVKQASTGYAIVITSPWSYLWWISFGPVIFDRGYDIDTLIDRVEVTIFFIFGIFIWVIIFNLGLKFSRQLASPKILKSITWISGAMILYFAGDILYRIIKIYI